MSGASDAYAGVLFGWFAACYNSTTIFKSPNSFRAFSRLPATPVLAALRRPALRASLLKNTHFSSVWASLFPVLSVCLASVREVSYYIDAGFCAVGCGWKVAAASDRSATNKPKRRALLAARSPSSAANLTRRSSKPPAGYGQTSSSWHLMVTAGSRHSCRAVKRRRY